MLYSHVQNYSSITYRCSEESSHCVVVVQYTPNLQDDSDANYNDQAGRMISMERGCDQVGGELT